MANPGQIIRNWLGVDVEYFAKNSFWVSFKNGAGMVVGLALGIAFARLVPKETYGQYTFILSTMYLVNFLAVPRFDVALSQAVARNYDRSLIVATKISLLGSLLASLVLAGVGLKYVSLGDPGLGRGLMWAAIFFPLLFGLRTYDHFLVGKKRFDRSAQIGALGSVLTGIALLAVMGRQNIGLMILAFLIVNGGLNLAAFIYTKTLMRNKRVESDVVRYGIYLTALSVTAMVVNRLGDVLLNHFQGASVLATYAVAATIPKALQNLMQNLIDVSKMKVADRNRDELVMVVRKHAGKWIAMGVVAAGSLWLTLPYIMPLVYSHKYDDAINYARMISLGLIFWPVNTFLGNLVLLEKKRKIIAISHFIPSVPNLVLYPLAIAQWGIWGLVGVNLLSWLYLTPFNVWAFGRKKDL